MDLYHADIRLPDNFSRLPDSEVELKWTHHAINASNTDRYGHIPRYNKILLSGCDVIEVGMEEGKVVHLLLRANFGQGDRDILFALAPIAGKPWTVKTVWFNKRNDRHKTLNKSRYMK